MPLITDPTKNEDKPLSPAEKAKQLVDKFIPLVKGEHREVDGMRLHVFIGTEVRTRYAKECALLCVEEILSAKHDCGCEQSIVIEGKYETYVTYWEQVIESIKAL